MRRCCVDMTLLSGDGIWYWHVVDIPRGRCVSWNTRGVYPLPDADAAPALMARLDLSGFGKAELRKWGNALRDAVLPKAIIEEMETYDAGIIRVTVPSEWGGVPFELCHFDHRGFLGMAFAISTYILGSKRKKPPGCDPGRESLKIVAVHEEGNAYSLQEGENIKRLARQKGISGIELRHSTNLRSFIRMIHDATVFHFTGHGYEGTHLDLGNGEKISAELLEDELVDHPNIPDFVYLSACESGSCTIGMKNIIGVFIRSGVKHVIGFMDKPRQQELASFAVFVYKELFRKYYWKRSRSIAERLFDAKRRFIREYPGAKAPYLVRAFGDALETSKPGRRPFIPVAIVTAIVLSMAATYWKHAASQTVLIYDRNVDSTKYWDKGGIPVKAGDSVVIVADTNCKMTLSLPRKIVCQLRDTLPLYPDNGSEGLDRDLIPHEKRHPYFVVPNAPIGALIAGVGQYAIGPLVEGRDPIWLAGKEWRGIVARSGYLRFTVNDIPLDSTRRHVYALDPLPPDNWEKSWEDILKNRSFTKFFDDNWGEFRIKVHVYRKNKLIWFSSE